MNSYEDKSDYELRELILHRFLKNIVREDLNFLDMIHDEIFFRQWTVNIKMCGWYDGCGIEFEILNPFDVSLSLHMEKAEYQPESQYKIPNYLKGICITILKAIDKKALSNLS